MCHKTIIRYKQETGYDILPLSSEQSGLFIGVMRYNTATLSNGLRIIHQPSSSPVVYCGYQINAGTADEPEGYEGIAHFCEHTTFKGTSRRSSLDVINCLESVGGDLNAYTTKTDTVYYAAILKDYLPKAVDLLTDIVFHSTYPQSEIDKEVEVICDEIESYNDSPAELIYDEFENIIFSGTPLGHNILGTAEQVRSYKTADAIKFTRKFYRPDNSIFFISGDVDFHVLTEMLAETFHAASAGSSAGPLPHHLSGGSIEPGSASVSTNEVQNVQGKVFVRHRNTHQAHVMLGRRSYSIDDDRRMALYLLNNILGGPGMNARLNLSLRERHGLVYTVESSMVSYAHTGLWTVYFGCDSGDVEQCLGLIREELDALMEHPLSGDALAAAKRQIRGQIGIASDNRENFALDFGKAFLHYGWERDIEKLYKRIDALTAQQLQDVAREIFRQEGLSTLIFE